MDDEPLQKLEQERNRLKRRLERERRARMEAESIAERAIRELSNINREYERFFDVSRNLFCTADSSLNFLELNPIWTDTLGWTVEELRARPLLEFLHPEDVERTRAEASRMLDEAGHTVDFKHRFRHKDGHWVWLNWTVTVANETYYAAATDVSQQLRDQQVLAETEARTRAILNSTADGIITIDHTGIILDVNPSVTDLFGYAKEDLLGRNVSILMPSPFRQNHDRYIQSYLQTGKPRVIGVVRELVGLRQDGRQFPIELAVGEVKVGERHMFTGIIRDITRRKVAESRLHDTLVDLKKSHESLLATLNQLRIKSMIIDPEGRVSFLSSGDGVGQGWPDPDKAVGKPWESVLPADAAARDKFRTVMRSKESERSRFSMSWRDSAGEHRSAEVEIKDDPRKLSSRIAFFYDTSELERTREGASQAAQSRMVGASDAMRSVYTSISKVATGDWTVLIEGETGVGKELVARAIHASSPRKSGPFVAVNCAALGDSLLESRLFGHRKGAFTGATTDQAGFFESASGGTILLDEIGDVSMKLQASLLRVIQEREVMRVGESKVRKVDVRILASTNRNLAEAVKAGEFREDLLYRLRVARITVPPLRDRMEDLPLLVASMLAAQRLVLGKLVLRLSDSALETLQSYHWPGNVRELKAVLEYAVIAAKGSVIQPHELPPEIRTDSGIVASPQAALPSPADDTADRTSPDERTQILEALEWAEGNRARAARKLGISRATLYRRLEEYGVPTKSKDAPKTQ